MSNLVLVGTPVGVSDDDTFLLAYEVILVEFDLTGDPMDDSVNVKRLLDDSPEDVVTVAVGTCTMDEVTGVITMEAMKQKIAGVTISQGMAILNTEPPPVEGSTDAWSEWLDEQPDEISDAEHASLNEATTPHDVPLPSDDGGDDDEVEGPEGPHGWIMGG